MKVKKFIAATIPEAMQQIRIELGKDAVILQSKEIKQGGFLGLFQKRKFEVIAALDQQPIAKTNQKVNLHQERESITSNLVTTTRLEKDVMKEIKHFKKILEQQSFSKHAHFQLDYQTIYNYLLTQEVHADIAKDIVASVVKKHESMEQTPDISDIVTHTEHEIVRRLHHLSFKGMTYAQQIIQFVGPTGVGKTTTLAKLAARSMLQDQKKVGFITTDTYRIAAIEQLKTYARILAVPVEVAYSVTDYKQAIKKFSHKDLIFVDTAGRNFRHEHYVKELTKQLKAHDQVKTFLVLSLTAKAKDISDIYKQFSHVPHKKVIFTKFDETRQYGSMLNIPIKYNVDIAYVTDGQDVPDDLLTPSAQFISHHIMSDYYDE